jgi:hypothetical protein
MKNQIEVGKNYVFYFGEDGMDGEDCSMNPSVHFFDDAFCTVLNVSTENNETVLHLECYDRIQDTTFILRFRLALSKNLTADEQTVSQPGILKSRKETGR